MRDIDDLHAHMSVRHSVKKDFVCSICGKEWACNCGFSKKFVECSRCFASNISKDTAIFSNHFHKQDYV